MLFEHRYQKAEVQAIVLRDLIYFYVIYKLMPVLH